jgi:hypothetical protein
VGREGLGRIEKRQKIKDGTRWVVLFSRKLEVGSAQQKNRSINTRVPKCLYTSLRFRENYITFTLVMKDLLTLTRIQGAAVIAFIIFKIVRPSILDSNAHQYFKTISLSLPNFFEGFIGTLLLTSIFLYINHKWIPNGKKLLQWKIYTLATGVASIYVLTQEFKIHNLGGNNVYDFNDVIFSILGLSLSYLVIYRIQPSIKEQPEN